MLLILVFSNAEARSISDFTWEIDEKYQRDGNVQIFAPAGSHNLLPIGIRGLNDVTVNLHPTINFDQTGMAKLPRGVNIYFEPSEVTVAKDEVKTVNLVMDIAKNAPPNLYDVQIVGMWKEEGRIPDFMGSSIRLHVGRDFGDGKIPINMMEPPLKFWKSIKNEKDIKLSDVPCRNDYVLMVKSSSRDPACVTFQTGDTLVKRGWATCDDGIDHGRGHPCGPRSSPIINFDADSYKPQNSIDCPVSIMNQTSNEPMMRPPPMEIQSLGKAVQTIEDAKSYSGIKNAPIPNYVPHCLELKQIFARNGQDDNKEIMLLYILSDRDTSTIKYIDDALQQGLAISFVYEKENYSLDWKGYVDGFVAGNPSKRHEVGDKIFLVTNRNKFQQSATVATTISDNLRITLTSYIMDSDEIKKIASSMFEK